MPFSVYSTGMNALSMVGPQLLAALKSLVSFGEFPLYLIGVQGTGVYGRGMRSVVRG